MTNAGRRLLVLLTLMPLLLVLGLGRGVVLCVAPGGHVQIEVAASSCCAGAQPTAPEDACPDEREPDHSDDCGSCTDLEIPIDRRASRSLADDLACAGGLTALRVETPLASGHGSPATRERGRSRDGLEPPHLIGLRSVVARC